MPQSYHQASSPRAARSLQRKDGLLGSDLGGELVSWWQANIYQVSGLSPTPNLVEHTPSTKGSPETYHVTIFLLGRQKWGNTHGREESRLDRVYKQTSEWVRSCCDLVKVHNFNQIELEQVVWMFVKMKIHLAETCLDLGFCFRPCKSINSFTPPSNRAPRPSCVFVQHTNYILNQQTNCINKFGLYDQQKLVSSWMAVLFSVTRHPQSSRGVKLQTN